jgi:hypothetical protein
LGFFDNPLENCVRRRKKSAENEQNRGGNRQSAQDGNQMFRLSFLRQRRPLYISKR